MPAIQTLSVASSALSATDQYVQWAAELGVSATDTLKHMDGDDNVWTFDLAAPCLEVGATHAEFSSEGMVGWSVNPKRNPSVATDFSRMYYASGVQPDHLLGFRYSLDCKSMGVKLQKAGWVTILGGSIAQLGTNAPTVDFAVRFSGVLNEPPQLVLSVGGGSPVARVGALRIAPDTQNFASEVVPAGSWATVSAQATPVNAGFHGLGRINSPASERWDDGDVAVQAGLDFHPVASPSSVHWNRAGSYDFVHHPIVAARQNIHFGGKGRIVGTVKESGSPSKPLVRRVQLVSQNTHALVAETWSDALGNYGFDDLDETQRYLVIAHDHTHLYRAVIADQLRAERP